MRRIILILALVVTPILTVAQVTLEDVRKLDNVELLQSAKEARAAGTRMFSATSLSGKNVDRTLLFTILKERGLYEPFGAVLNAAATFGDAGTNGVPAAQTDTIQTKTLGVVDWESEHYFASKLSPGDDKYNPHQPDFSFGGRIGFAPALLLVDLT